MPTQLQKFPENRQEVSSSPTRVIVGGSALLALAGIAGAALAILGLAGVLPGRLDGLSLIVLGGGLVLGSWLFRTPSNPLPEIPLSGRRIGMGGFTTQVLMGLMAVVFGILALTRMSTVNLIAPGVIALGIALWAGSAAKAQIAMARPRTDAGGGKTSAGMIGLCAAIGIGASFLGILAFLGVSPRPLALVSVLAAGLAVLLAGTMAPRRSGRRSATHFRS